MRGHGKSDGPVVPAKAPNKPALAGAGAVEEGAWAGATRSAKRVPDTEPGKARRVRWIACAESQAGTRMCGALVHHVDVDRLRAA
jgi:hypothetical protein